VNAFHGQAGRDGAATLGLQGQVVRILTVAEAILHPYAIQVVGAVLYSVIPVAHVFQLITLLEACQAFEDFLCLL